jgi:hypothetical protein
MRRGTRRVVDGSDGHVREAVKVVKLSLNNLMSGELHTEEGWRVVATVSAPHALPAFVGKIKGDVFVLLAKTEDVGHGKGTG